jgi:hypothetical protein
VDLPRHKEPLAELKLLQEKVLKADPAKLKQKQLHTFIDKLQIGLEKVHNNIDKTYFLHV